MVCLLQQMHWLEGGVDKLASECILNWRNPKWIGLCVCLWPNSPQRTLLYKLKRSFITILSHFVLYGGIGSWMTLPASSQIGMVEDGKIQLSNFSPPFRKWYYCFLQYHSFPSSKCFQNPQCSEVVSNLKVSSIKREFAWALISEWTIVKLSSLISCQNVSFLYIILAYHGGKS